MNKYATEVQSSLMSIENGKTEIKIKKHAKYSKTSNTVDC